MEAEEKAKRVLSPSVPEERSRTLASPPLTSYQRQVVLVKNKHHHALIVIRPAGFALLIRFALICQAGCL